MAALPIAPGFQVYKYNQVTAKKMAFAAHSTRQEPAHGGAVEFQLDFELEWQSNDDGTVQLSFNLAEHTGSVYVGIWSKFAFHVRSLVNEQAPKAGRQTIVWDGLNDKGEHAGNGTFIVRLSTEREHGASQVIEVK